MQYLIKEKNDIDLLIENKVHEGLMIDYKKELPDLNEEKNKLKFLKDICSFSNSHGGQIIYGIEEDKGVPVSIIGVISNNFDDLKLKFLNIILTGIEQRVSNISIDLINHTNKTLLIINIPSSLNAPHRVSFNGHNKFYGRTSGGNYELSITEIKEKFVMMSTVKDNIKKFRNERVRDIVDGKLPVVLDEGPKILLHIIPLSAFASNLECGVIEIKNLFQKDMGLFYPLGNNLTEKDITLDGFLTFSGSRAYTQFYRVGIVEAVATFRHIEKGNEKVLPSSLYENKLIRQRYLNVLQALNFAPPFYFFLSLLNIRGLVMEVFPGYEDVSRKKYPENEILLREIIVENFEKSPAEILKPSFDQLCNAWGFDMCPHFNKDGSYRIR